MQFIQIQEIPFLLDPITKQEIKNKIKDNIHTLYEILRDKQVDINLIQKVFFRLDIAFNWVGKTDEISESVHALLKVAQNRFPESDIYFVYSESYEIRLLNVRGEVVGVDEADSILSQLQTEELRDLALNTGSLYEANQYQYFKHPSGQVSDFFFRVGNCQSTRANLSKLGFWIIPQLNGVQQIICDTWSISTFGMFLSNMVARYTGKRCECEYLPAYLGNDSKVSKKISNILEITHSNKMNPLFIVSASASGRLVREYHEVYSKYWEGISAKIAILFQLSNASSSSIEQTENTKILYNLFPDLYTRGLEGFVNEDDITDGKPIYLIDKVTYFPRYFEPKVHPFIPSKHAKLSKLFFERYGGRKIFSVCRNGASNSSLNLKRHHAFHVDIKKLLATDEFQVSLGKLIDVKTVKTRPTHIVHLTKEADEIFAKCVLEYLGEGADVKQIKMSDFRSIPKTQPMLNILNDRYARVWFLDAMYITGQSTAQGFQLGLRAGLEENSNLVDTEGEDKHLAELSYIVGVLRPDSDSKVSSSNGFMLKKCCDTLEGIIHVHAVETVLLPNWDESKCPWCKERALHEAILAKHSSSISGIDRRYIENRLDKLGALGFNGTRDELFFKRYPQHGFTFNVGSHWLDTNKITAKCLEYSEADVMMAVSSALQYWRDSYRKLPPAQFLLSQEDCFSVNKYNETLLRASIWRALKQREIDKSNSDEFAGDLLQRVFDERGDGDQTECSDEFVLGWEASRLLGPYLKRVISNNKFDDIDWNYLRLTASMRI